MAAKGADAATINDITEAADVGFGSFYNHFTSKEDVLEAATNELFDVIGGKIDEAIYAIADPCVALATATRTFVGVLMLKKEWAQFIIRISSPPGYKRFQMYSRLFRDIRKIHTSKRLEVADPEVVTYAVGGAILFMIIALVEGDLPEAHAPERIAAMALRMLGEKEEVIRTIVALPLPIQETDLLA
jgi:AcrR family transcriptional regulator